MNILTVKENLPVASEEFYLSSVLDTPVLTEDEEYALAKEYQDNKSVEAAQKLVLSNLKFVAHIVRGYSGYGLSQSDLMQEGNIGLMKAVKKFDPERKVRLISFAVHWIKAEIHEFIIKNWRIVKIATTKDQRKLFFNLRKNKTKLGYVGRKEAKKIAESLNVSEKTVEEMDKRMSYSEYSFDTPENSYDNSYTLAECLSSADSESVENIVENEENHNNKILLGSLSSLDNRSKDIIERRWLKEPKSTLHDLAHKYGISAERVRQIENSAMLKMRNILAPSIQS